MPGTSVDSLVDLLRMNAADLPQKRIYTYLDKGEIESDIITCGELDRRARAIAATLNQYQCRGERALLLYPSGLEFIRAFFGCLYSAVIAVPAYPPDPARLNRTLPRLLSIVKDARPRLALTTSAILSLIEYMFGQEEEFRNITWIATDAIADGMAAEWREESIRGEELAFLQYTSGSTSSPKGVMVSHANLLHNEQAIKEAFEETEHSIAVGWLPLYHDMGLIGNVIQPLYLGCQVILMSPIDLLKRPYLWLQAITRYRATSSGGPNFAYELCTRKVAPEERSTLDLSSWRLAFNGAEPLRLPVLERFTDYFAPCGFSPQAFYPCYGLAESTLFVSGAKRGCGPVTISVNEQALRAGQVKIEHGEQALSLVSSGHSALGQQIIIVDPETARPLSADQVGEIWLSGPSVAQGYWQKPEATEETFRAYLADGSRRGPYLRTGDLGFLRDGELYVTGRLKDLIIVRGRNYYPQDIEWTVEQSHAALRRGCSAAFALELDGVEQLAVAAEVDTKQRYDIADLVSAIRKAVFAAHELPIGTVLLLAPGAIPKTSSGKIQRHACRNGYLDGSLELIHRDILTGPAAQGLDESAPQLTREELLAISAADRQARLQYYLIAQISLLLGVESSPLCADSEINSVGLDSLKAYELKGRIEADLKLGVADELLFTNSTIKSLAAFLANSLDEADIMPPVMRRITATSLHPLSSSQQRLLFLEQLQPGNWAYHIPAVVRLSGELDIAALEKSFNDIAGRHEALRTAFIVKDGEQLQQVHEQVNIPLKLVSLLDVSESERGACAQQLISEAARKPFDLAVPPLLRTTLIRMGESQYLLVLVMHHIIADGWSMNVLIKELTAIYNNRARGQSLSMADLPYQYRDFTYWQREQIAGDKLESLINYWKQRLKQLPPPLHLPTDFARPATPGNRGAQQRLLLSRQLTDQLEAISKREGVTVFMILLAAFKAWLCQRTGQTDIVVGSPVANRKRREFEDLIGFFVNTIVLRTDLGGQPSFTELLGRVRKTAVAAYAHSDLPFEKLVEVMRPDRRLSATPLVQVGFALLNLPTAALTMAGIDIELLDFDPETAKLDLNLTIEARDRDLTAVLEYRTELFEPATARQMLVEFSEVLARYLADPDLRITISAGGKAGTQAVPEASQALQPVDLFAQSNLTRNQLLIWMGQKLQPELPLYNMAELFTIAAPIEPDCFQAAFQALINSSDAMRTVIIEENGIPQQVVLEQLTYQVDYFDMSHLADSAEELERWSNERCRRAFDLSQALFDCALIKLSPQRFAWFIKQHHIIIDRGSLALQLQYLIKLYRLAKEGLLPHKLELPAYRDYVAYEREYRNTDAYKKAQEYWAKKLAADVATPRFYGKLPVKGAARVERVSCPLGIERSEQIKALARRQDIAAKTENATLFNIFAAALAAFLYRIGNNGTISIGVPFHNRRSQQFKETIGLFMEVLPLHVSVEAQDSFVSLVNKVMQEAAETLSHRQFAVGNPVNRRAYDVFLNFHTVSFPDFAGGKVQTHWVHPGYEDESFALQVHDLEGDGNFALDFDLQVEIFDPHLRQQVVNHFLRVLDNVLEDCQRPLADISLLSDGEAHRLIYELNDTTAPFPSDSTLSQLFEARAAKNPDQVAVICAQRSLTYAQLNAQANRLAALLRAHGAGPEKIIGLCVDRSLDMAVGLLAILKSGAAYLPLDPAYPRQRLAYLCEDAQLSLIVTQEKLVDILPNGTCRKICLDTASASITGHSSENFHNGAGPDNLAYVIYTSGSTGKPKGVMISNRNVVNHACASISLFKLNSNDRVLQFHTINFDAAVEEIFPCWLSGATLVLRDSADISLGATLLQQLDDYRISILNLPTPYWHEWVLSLDTSSKALPAALRLVVVGGDKASLQTYKTWRAFAGARIRWINTYGPTEATVTTTYYYPQDDEKLDSLGEIPIGRPIANARVYLLDENLQPVPCDLPGEIYIGGEGVARGYLNAAELSSQKFIEDPFNRESGARLYKTGDLARLLPDGNILFIGRADSQVKVRGFRIEVGEIESHLCEHASVREAVVAAREGSEKQLIAYIVAEKNLAPTTSELRAYLKERLPEYMIPSAFVMLDRLPLTASGKVDRQALPAPDRQRPHLASSYVAPKTEIEHSIAAIWQQALGLEKIGIEDNFFDLGGHSMLMAQVQIRLQAVLGRDIPMVDLFHYPTISSLAGHLTNQHKEQPATPQIEQRAKKQQEALNRLANARLHSRRGNK